MSDTSYGQSTRASALVISTIPVFPARANGLSIRYVPILERLAATHAIDVALVLDHNPTKDQLEEKPQYVDRVQFFARSQVRRPTALRVFARMKSLLGCAVPSPVFRYDSQAISEYFSQLAAERYELVILTDSTLAGLVRKAFPNARLVVDAIDSRYLLYRRSAKRSPLSFHEAKQMRAWERRIAITADHMSFISNFDMQAAFGSVAPPNVSVIPNGVYEADFTHESVERKKHTIVFLGNMGYRPNILAAERAAAVLQIVRESLPDAQLVVVGRSPSERAGMLGQLPGVTVTGTVPSVWPYLRSAAVCLFPMSEGAGLQNKLLEAMKVGTPVVTTPIGNLGVGAVDDRDLLIGESDEDLAEQVVRALGSPDLAREVGSNGQAYIERTFSWDQSWALVQRHWLSVGGGDPSVR